MGHCLRTDIPQVKKHFVLNWPHVANFNTLDKKFKSSQKRNYDKRHRSKQLPELPDKLPVWVESQGKQVPGEVIEQAAVPPSYLVETPLGEVRHNCCYLRVRLENADDSTSQPKLP